MINLGVIVCYANLKAFKTFALSVIQMGSNMFVVCRGKDVLIVALAV